MTSQEISELEPIKKRLRRFKEYRKMLTEEINNCSKQDYIKLQGLKAWVDLEILELKNRSTEIYSHAICRNG